MTRAKIKLAGALVAALGLVVLLTWYQQPRASRTTGPAFVTGQVMRPAPEPAAATMLAGAQSTSQSTAELPAVDAAQESATPLPTAVLERDRAFINQAFPALSSWSVTEVKSLLSDAALQASTDDQLTQVMTTLNARLGTLQSFEAPQPASVPEALQYANTTASLQPYTFIAYYEAGEAEVNLVLEKQAQRSSLYSFDIHVPN